jgi:DNA-binding transcriptional MerR regulator
MYRIGDLSRLTQVPVKTLRYYDEIGLLRPAGVERSSGYRYYTAAQFERLNRILVFRDLGFTLREIRSLIADNVPPEQIRGMLRLRHEELARRVGRESARLARAAARLELLQQGAVAAASDVAVRSAGARLVASVRDTIATHDECERLFEELERGTGGRCRRRQRGAVWHACEAGRIDCEAFAFLPSPIEGSGRIRVYEMPAQPVASLVYRGDGDFLSAYRTIRSWITASGVEVTGPKREIYLDDGRRDGESVTEIQFPIRVGRDSIH